VVSFARRVVRERRDTTDISREIARQAGFELTSNVKVGFKVDVVNVDFSGGTNAKTGLNDAEGARQEITYRGSAPHREIIVRPWPERSQLA
jgi:hypothetical protein